MPANKAADAKTPALLQVKKSRPKRFALVKDAPQVPVPDEYGNPTRTFVTRGKLANDASENATEYLVVDSGEKQVGVPMHAVGHAILGGAIPRDQIEQTLALQ